MSSSSTNASNNRKHHGLTKKGSRVRSLESSFDKDAGTITLKSDDGQVFSVGINDFEVAARDILTADLGYTVA